MGFVVENEVVPAAMFNGAAATITEWRMEKRSFGVEDEERHRRANFG
jgi:hypothetical protein